MKFLFCLAVFCLSLPYAQASTLTGQAITLPQAQTTIDREQVVALGRLMMDDLLSRETFMMYEVEDVAALHYAEAAAMMGAARFAGATDDRDRLTSIASRVRRVDEEGLPNTANHVDANVVAVAPFELFLQGAGDGFLPPALILANGQWDNPREDGLTPQTRFWIDDVWMIGALQSQAFRATGNPVYVDRAALMAEAYIRKLQQPNGLFFHGPEAPFHWGRGNGWVAAGLAEVISVLPPEHPSYPVVIAGYEKMMSALLQYQAEDGMWRQLIDDPQSWKETSSTAMFGYAFLKGVQSGVLDDPAYRQAYENAWNALTTYVEADGKISDVCVGTGQSRDAAYYLERPTVTGDLHGQAPMLWFAAALLSGD